MLIVDIAQRCEQPGQNSPFPSRWARVLTADRYAVWCLGLVTIVPLLTFGFALGALPITTPNEGLYGQIAREMLERHDWVVPHINSVLYFEKPPLLYWLCALCMSVLGVTPLAARLPSALGSVLLSWLIFWMGYRQYNLRIGTYAALILSTSIGFVLMARQVMFDALLTTCMTASLVAFWMATAPPLSGKEQARTEQTGDGQNFLSHLSLIYVTYASLGLAVLTKGLIGLLLPLLTLLAYATLTRDWQRLRPLWHRGGIALFIAVVMPWHILIALRHREWVWFYFVNEHVLRFLGQRQPKDYYTGNILTPVCGFFVQLLPWSIFLPALCARLWTDFRTSRRPAGSVERSLTSKAPGSGWNQTTIFNLCWFLVPFLFFTVSHTRTLYYLLPVLPPLTLLMGDWWGHAVAANIQVLQRRWIAASVAAALAVGISLWLWSCTQIGSHSLRSGRLSLVAFSLCWLLLGMGCTLIVLQRSTPNAAFTCFAAGTLATALVASGLAAYAAPYFPTCDSEQPLAKAIVNAHPPADTVVAMGDRLENHSAFVFYLPQDLRPILIVNGQRGGDLEFGSHAPEARHLFISYNELNQLAQERPLFLLTNLPLRHHLAATLRPFYQSGKTMLWTNLPPNKLNRTIGPPK